MKRNTLILLLVAIVGGGAVYYLEVKPGKPRDEVPETSKPAFNFKREEINAITLTRGSEKPVNFEMQNNKWFVRQPIEAPADESAMNGIIGDLVSARVDRDFPGDDLKAYGLAEPAVKLEIKLKNGQTHRLDLGSKDPLGSFAYAKIDGAQNVSLISSSVLTNTDKSLNDLRDRSLLGATQYELGSVKITNESGTYELEKKDSDWMIKSPFVGIAEETEVATLLGDVTSAKAVEITSETIDDPAKYGLDKPKLSFTARFTAGGERTVSLGSKVDDKSYYARTSDLPQLYKVDLTLLRALSTKVATLRSKSLVKLDRNDLTRVQIKNPNVTIVAEKNNEGKWLVKEPADKKDKEAYSFKLIDPLEAKATEVIDRATGAIAAKLAKPEVEVRLTGKNGTTTVIKISSADGENAYARVEGRPEIYKVAKSMLESLSFKIEEAIAQT
jgi:Domain of unknown function (DUF4340)